MADYTADIVKNLARFSGIVEYPERVAALNDMLNDLDGAGFGKLVRLCTTRRDDQALDVLFEAWLGQMLRRNLDVRDLAYEPEDMGTSAPDFRFWMGDVRIDMQVKRLYAVSNARDKTMFRRRFEERASGVPVPWFLDLWLSTKFAQSDIDGLFYHIHRGVKAGAFTPGANDAPPAFNYQWPPESAPDDAKARFSFHAASGPEALPHLHLGVIMLASDFQEVRPGTGVEMLAQRIDQNEVRRALDFQLNKARHTLTLDPGPRQSNLVVVQPEGSIGLWLGQNMVADALYGDDVTRGWVGVDGEVSLWDERDPNGLFRPDQYRKMCGLIVVPPSVWPLSERFEGMYFPHPLYLSFIGQHPKPFPEMTFHVKKAWKRR